MNEQDRIRLRTLVGLPPSYPNFAPDTDSGDNGMLMEYLLSAGWRIQISKRPDVYECRLGKTYAVEDIGTSAPTRNESLSLACLALCP